MQHIRGKHRQEHLIRHPQEIRHRQKQENGTDRCKAPGVAHAGVRLCQQGRPGRRRGVRRQAHRPYCHQERQITEAVEEKTDAFPQAHNHEAREGRANEASAIGDRGVEGQGVAQVGGLLDELAHQRLACGHIQGIDHPQQDTAQEHMPERGAPGQHQPG